MDYRYALFNNSNTDQKMNLIMADFFSEFKAKGLSNRVKIKEKLNASEKKQFNDFVSDSKNLKLLNIMSNICYKKFTKNKKDLGFLWTSFLDRVSNSYG